MTKFFLGFALASLFWGGFLVAYNQGWIDISLEPEAPPVEAAADTTEAESEPDGKVKRKRRSVASKRARPARTEDRDTLVGDDLGADDPRQLNMHAGGGEEQLLGTEIEKGFDSVFSQIRRCLILAASDEPARGKLTFGLRITGSGKVSAVNLSGPSSVARGESGACLRKAASGIQFRSFNGPDMVVHYPITLD